MSGWGCYQQMLGGGTPTRRHFDISPINGNDIQTKAEQSFDLGFLFDIEANEPAYSRTCKDRSEGNPAYSTPQIEAKRILFIPQI
jgi:hypothetical protein